MTRPGPPDPATVGVAPHPRGAVLDVRAQPGARRNGVQGVHAGALRVSVIQVAERGRANEAIVAALGRALAIPVGRLELLSGATNRQKRVLVVGLAPEEVAARVAAALSKVD